MERETGFEPATLALARRCSTTELFPPRSQKKRNYTGSTREASRRGDRELGSDQLLDRRNVTLRQVLGDERIDRKREELTGNRKDEHAWRGAIGWRRAGLTQGNREPGSVGMPAASVLHSNLRHIDSTLLRAQAEVPQTVTVMPDQAERTAGRKLLAALAGQDRALHTGDRFPLELDPYHITDDLLDQLVFIAEDGAPFLFKPFLLQRVPNLEVIGVGVQSRADLAAVGKLPCPQVLVLHVLQEPGGRGAVSPLPGEHGAALFQIKTDIRQSFKRLFGRDMVVQDLEFRGFLRHLFQDRPRISEVHEHHPTPRAADRRREPVVGRNELGRRIPLPDGPGSTEPVGAVGMVEDEIRNHNELAYHDPGARERVGTRNCTVASSVVKHSTR